MCVLIACLTESSCLQNIYEGGSGLSVMRQVKFMVLPSLRCMSGPPNIAVLGSETQKKRTFHFIRNRKLKKF